MFQHGFWEHTFEILLMLIGAFLMGLWLGWLLWSKYKRLVEGLIQEKESLEAGFNTLKVELATANDKLVGLEGDSASLQYSLESLQWEHSELLKKMKVVETDLAEQLKINNKLGTELSNLQAQHTISEGIQTEVLVSPIDIPVESLVDDGENIEEAIDSIELFEEVSDQADLEDEVMVEITGEISDLDEIEEMEEIVEVPVEEEADQTETFAEEAQNEAEIEAVSDEAHEEPTSDIAEDMEPLAEEEQTGSDHEGDIDMNTEVSEDILAEIGNAGLATDLAEIEQRNAEVEEKTELTTPAPNKPNDLPFAKVTNQSVIVRRTTLVGKEESESKTVSVVRRNIIQKNDENEVFSKEAEQSNTPWDNSLLNIIEDRKQPEQGKNTDGTAAKSVEDSIPEVANDMEEIQESVVSEIATSEAEQEEPIDEVALETETETTIESNTETIIEADTESAADDLKKIEGIGPKTEELLRKNGISSYVVLAKTPVAELRNILLSVGYSMINPESWPAQALLAAHGDWENLKTYQGYLIGGKRPN